MAYGHTPFLHRRRSRARSAQSRAQWPWCRIW